MRRLLGLLLSVILLLFTLLTVEVETKEFVEPIEETIIYQRIPRVHPTTYNDEQEEIRNEILYGELELLAQLIQAEAGNQDEMGKRYVADCVLNRVDSDRFPDSIESVIYQSNPIQFSCTVDGNLDKAAWTVTEDCFQIAIEEYENRTDSSIIYFRTDHYSESGHPAFQYGDHYFSTL